MGDKNIGVVQRHSTYRRASRARRCREYFYGGGGGGGASGAAGGTPALSPAALHLEFNDVSIFRVGGAAVSDAMLPVGHSDSSLGPLQVSFGWDVGSEQVGCLSVCLSVGSLCIFCLCSLLLCLPLGHTTRSRLGPALWAISGGLEPPKS